MFKKLFKYFKLIPALEDGEVNIEQPRCKHVIIFKQIKDIERIGGCIFPAEYKPICEHCGASVYQVYGELIANINNSNRRN
jgi:hypothetical protein